MCECHNASKSCRSTLSVPLNKQTKNTTSSIKLSLRFSCRHPYQLPTKSTFDLSQMNSKSQRPEIKILFLSLLPTIRLELYYLRTPLFHNLLREEVESTKMAASRLHQIATSLLLLCYLRFSSAVLFSSLHQALIVTASPRPGQGQCFLLVQFWNCNFIESSWLGVQCCMPAWTRSE